MCCKESDMTEQLINHFASHGSLPADKAFTFFYSQVNTQTPLPRLFKLNWHFPSVVISPPILSFGAQRRSPGGGHGNPLQYSFLLNPMDRGAWQATVHGVAQSQARLRQRAQSSVIGVSFIGGACVWLSMVNWKPSSF